MLVLRTSPIALLLAGLLSGQLAAQAPASRPLGEEPGAAEARQAASTQPLITAFTHPEREVRAVWIVPKDMNLDDHALDTLLSRLQSAGLNTLLVDTSFRGAVAYPDSKHLPQFRDFQGTDPIRRILTAARARGLAVHLWMEYGFYAYFTPDPAADRSMGRLLDAHPDLVSVNAAGEKAIARSFGTFYSMCPSNPKCHAFLAELYAEAVTRYPEAQGLNLDRIRYTSAEHCYCDYCRKTFAADTGITLPAPGPGTIALLPTSPDGKKFLDWKRERTADAVRTIAARVRAVRPDLVLTSYVVGPAEMDDKAQGWDLWVSRGLLDAVAVSMYGPDPRQALADARRRLGNDVSRLLPALNAEVPSALLASNVELTRRAGLRGQFFWHLGLLHDDLDALTAGPYAAPAATTLAPKP